MNNEHGSFTKEPKCTGLVCPFVKYTKHPLIGKTTLPPTPEWCFWIQKSL